VIHSSAARAHELFAFGEDIHQFGNRRVKPVRFQQRESEAN
jgi:hypothetical protein